MRNRPDISYLTILGFSLTVVIAMQKGDSCEDSVRFKLSDADGHHICYLSVDAIRDAFLAVSHEQSSFVFGYNAPSFATLTSSFKVLVDVNGQRLKGSIPIRLVPDEDFKTRDHIPDTAGIIALASSFSIGHIQGFNFLQGNDLVSYLHLSAFPARAGPERIL